MGRKTSSLVRPMRVIGVIRGWICALLNSLDAGCFRLKRLQLCTGL
jgi:hypothetical protein